MSKIQAVDAILQLGVDGVTYKAVVCEQGHTYNRERSTNSIETKCYGGVASVSIGAKSGTIDFTGAFETQPSTEQVSANDIMGYFENATYIYWLIESPTGVGNERYRQGRGYITSLSEDSQIGEVVIYNFTLTIDGDVTTTP